MKTVTLALALFVMGLASAAAQQVTISPPAIDSLSQFTQVGEVDDGPMDHYFYWCWDSPAEGTLYLRAEADELPVLNLDNPQWREIDADAYFDALSFQFVAPSAQEAAWLTDCAAYTRTSGSFSSAYYLIWWDDYSLSELQSLSDWY